MKKQIVWLILSCLMALSLVLASCVPEVTEEEAEVVTPTVEEEEEEVVPAEEMLEEKPQHGGTFVVAVVAQTTFHAAESAIVRFVVPVYEGLLAADISRGPRGTKEIDLATYYVPDEYYTGYLAESWEQPDLKHLVFTIRKGVHFHDRPPVHGREMTAEDVAFSINFAREYPRGLIYAPPGMPEEETYRASVDPTDKWKVIVALPEPSVEELRRIGTSLLIFPPELAELDLEDWRNMVGTGPFMAEDSAVGSSTTYTRHPLHWQFDPFQPENRLPYVDVLKILIIPDVQTQLAALRVGKIDKLHYIAREEALLLQEASPQLKSWTTNPVNAIMLDMQNNKEPFTDKRVRQAISMAIDHPGMAEDFYQGAAQILTWPLAESHGDIFTPLEELPDAIRILFEHRPEEAKQLLAEAGYPNGFTTECIVTAEYVDLLSIIQANLRDIGVDMEIKVLETGAYWGQVLGRNVPQMSFASWGNTAPMAVFQSAYYSREGEPHMWNFSYVVDTHMAETYDKIKVTLDPVERDRLAKELDLYALEECFSIQTPSPDIYTFWQPWVKGYLGEETGHVVGTEEGVIKYLWVDQDLKYEMTGRR